MDQWMVAVARAGRNLTVQRRVARESVRLGEARARVGGQPNTGAAGRVRCGAGAGRVHRASVDRLFALVGPATTGATAWRTGMDANERARRGDALFVTDRRAVPGMFKRRHRLASGASATRGCRGGLRWLRGRR